MEDPDIISQTGEPVLDPEAQRRWFSERVAEGRDFGVTWARYSIHPELKLLLFEGWKFRPTVEGEPRWMLTDEERKWRQPTLDSTETGTNSGAMQSTRPEDSAT